MLTLQGKLSGWQRNIQVSRTIINAFWEALRIIHYKGDEIARNIRKSVWLLSRKAKVNLGAHE